MPLSSTSSFSHSSIAAGRCAITMADLPSDLRPRIARLSAAEPSCVEIGIRLIEHQQHRIAIKRARQADALDLPARQARADIGDLGVIALRLVHDDLMRGGAARGLRRSVRDRDWDRAGRCFRQWCRRKASPVAADSRSDRPNRSAVVLVERCAIEPDLAARRQPDPDERARQSRFPGPRRADDADSLPGLDLERHHAQGRLVFARRHDRKLVHIEFARRGGAVPSAAARPGWCSKALCRLCPALTRPVDHGPLADGQFNRRQAPGPSRMEPAIIAPAVSWFCRTR